MLTTAALCLGLATTAPPRGPVLRFTDKKTKCPVVLVSTRNSVQRGAILRICQRARTRSQVGCMHYNPSSIALAQQTVDYEAEQNGVRAVLVESCPTRWNATLDAQPPGSLLRSLCDNEMQAGAEAGERVGATLVLGDQEIETTGKRVSALFAQTLVQLLTPRGWQLIAEDFANGIAQLRNPGGLPPTALLAPDLLLGLPVTVVRYPLSLGVKSPLLGLLVAALLFGGLFMDASGAGYEEESLAELGRALSFALFETLVIGRVFLVGLLEERNFVLARKIREAALGDGKRGTRTVVAILGAAHLNGVKTILEESRVM